MSGDTASDGGTESHCVPVIKDRIGFIQVLNMRPIFHNNQR